MNTSLTRQGIRRLTVTALLTAISIILGLTPLGYLRLGPVEVTLMCLPVIIGTIIEGLSVGMLLGVVFGLTSFAQIFMGSALGAALFSAQPLFTVIIIIAPRLLIPLAVHFVVEGFGRTDTEKVKPLVSSIAAAAGSLTNTIGFLTLTFFLMREPFASFLGISADAAGKTLFSIGLANGIPEAIAAVLIVTPVVIAVQRMVKATHA